MNSKKIRLLILCFLSLSFLAFAENKEGKNNQLNKVTGSPVRAYMNINGISTQIYNDGNSDIDPSGNSGLVYPKGSGKTAVFESGFLWGAKLGGSLRIGGSTYSQGLQPGKILSPGVAEDPNLDKNRIYRVRPDVYPGGPDVDLLSASTDEGIALSNVRTQYEKDWTEWPATDGAPYFDGNNNGVYDPTPVLATGTTELDPTSDIPGVTGADQTIWFVSNDLDAGKTTKLYGTQPMGVEMQATFWAYAQTGALGSMFFREYKIINKATVPFNEMYVSMWSDVDLGNAVDDYSGCDTVLSLGYTYNANAVDATYSPLPPPAVGFDFFQGPRIQVNADSSYFLPMTAFYYFARGDASVTDPTLGSVAGATQFYNFLQGKIGLSGEYFVDPTTGQPTTFALPGDPQTKKGWVDGMLIPAGDRRIGLASGPFEMAVGDTQVVVVAEIVAGALPGMDRLSALGLLKFYDRKAQFAYDNAFNLPVAPPSPDVKAVELDRQIVLDWGEDVNRVRLTEEYAAKGYKFEGYNIYQLPSASATVEEGVRLATFDIINDVAKIEDEFFDSKTGVIAQGVQQFGNESGIQRFFNIRNDELKGGTPLINGIRYYYAVTAYGYNPDPTVPTKSLENPLSIITVMPHSPSPGVTYDPTGLNENVEHTSGLADAVVTVNVVDPTKLTGHEYEVFFDVQHYYLDSNAVWKTTNYPDSIGKFGKDISPARFDVAGIWSTEPGTIDLMYVLDLDTSNTSATGFTLTFPTDVVIDSAFDVETGEGTTDTAAIIGNTISYGVVTPDTNAGNYHGGEVVHIRINKVAVPLSVGYTIFDDGQEGPPVNAVGTAVLTEIGNQFVTQYRWNLKDLSTNEVKVTANTIFGGQDVYAGLLGPGGSTKSQYPGVGETNNPIVDGLQFLVTGSFDAPITIDHFTRNGNPVALAVADTGRRYDFTDFTFFGNPTGEVIDQWGYGTRDLVKLQQDYEIRVTGIVGDTTINGKKVFITKEGGSYATFFGARQYDWHNHPLNVNHEDRFLVRIPFEIWNKDTDQQVNYEIYDRAQTDPTSDNFYVWNPRGRMYANIINTPYSPTVIPEGDPQLNEATWTNAWYASHWVTGDVLGIFYANPIVLGTDVYHFKAPTPGYSTEQAKQDLNKINVFPNPYYGVNSEELNKYNRFVMFTHLPPKAKIRIFNLAGVLVKTLDKDDPSQFQRWDLANQSGLPVASGLYIAYIDMPELGSTKILKLAIIQEQQILDRF